MKLINWLDKNIEEYLIIIFSAVMVLVISLQIFMRFILGSSIGWSEELARYCFIWLIYLGVSLGVKKQRHIHIDILVMAFKDKGKVILNIIANILFLVLAIFAVVYGGKISIQLMGWGQTSPGLGLPMYFVYLASPVGFGLTAIRLIQQLVNQFKYLRGNGASEAEVRP